MTVARIALRIVLLAAAFAVATVLLGWWGVPVVAIAWGFLGRESRGAGVGAGISALIAWAFLLAWSASRGPVGNLAATLGEIMGAPAAALVALVLIFPAALAWAGARAASGFAAVATSRES